MERTDDARNCDTQSPPRVRTFKDAIDRQLVRFLVVIVAVFVVGCCGRLWWPMDLANHFQVQYLIFLVTAVVWFGLRGHWNWACLGLLCCGWSLWQLTPMWLDRSHHATDKSKLPDLRMVSANLYAGNDSPAALEFLKKQEADVLLLQEVTPAWNEMLRELADEFPHSVIQPREDAFGMALLSRTPLKSASIHEFGRVPWIAAVINKNGRDVYLLGAHTLPPVGADYSARRNEQLSQINTLRQSAEKKGFDVVVAGDLNCTPWSPYFSLLLAETKLHDARRGFGVVPSWPVQRIPLLIPIDHVLISDRLRVVDFRKGPHVGSDHFPIVVDLSFE